MMNNYEKRFLEENEIKEEIVDYDEVVDEVIDEPKEGFVTGCVKLNVREKPETNSDVICIIKLGDKIIIDNNYYNKDYYKVYTVSGIEGYCVKKYISI